MPAKPGTEPVMSRDEMKPLLLLSKREPVSCAVGLTRDKQGTLLLHRKTKPRKLLAELKRQAASSGLELDAASLRFGRASVDGNEAGTVRFTVNKAAPAALRMKLVEQLRPAGFQKCELLVDEALEAEPDEDGPGQPGEGPRAPGQASATSTAASSPSPAPDAEPDATNPAPDTGPGGPAASPSGSPASMREHLTGLVRRVADAATANPAGAAPLKAAAVQAREALRAGDLARASRGADALERLLGGQPGGAGPDASAGPADDARADGLLAQGQDAPPMPDAAANGAAPDGAPPATGPVPTGAGAASLARPAPGQPRHPAGSPLFAKGRDAWNQVHTKLSADLGAAAQALTARAGHGTDMAREVEQFIKPIMAGLDDSLARKLDEITKTSDPSTHAQQVQDAVGILGRYKAFAAGNEAVAHLDKNPVHPVAIGRTLATALAALEKVVRTSDGPGADTAEARAA